MVTFPHEVESQGSASISSITGSCKGTGGGQASFLPGGRPRYGH